MKRLFLISLLILGLATTNIKGMGKIKELQKSLRLIRSQIKLYEPILEMHNNQIPYHTYSMLANLYKTHKVGEKISEQIDKVFGFKNYLLEQKTENFIKLTIERLESAEADILKKIKAIRKEKHKKQKKKDFEERVDFMIQLEK